MKLAGLIAIVLSFVCLCNGQDYDIGRCNRVTQWSCNWVYKFCYKLIVCRIQAHYFYDTIQKCQFFCV